MNKNRTKQFKLLVRTSFTVQEVLSFLVLIGLILVSARYCDLHDYRGYYLSYVFEHKMEIEIGYTALAELFYQNGYPFYAFYGVIVTISLVLYYKFIREYSKNLLAILIIFVIYPYINAVQQIRSFLGAAIVLMGMKFLLEKEIKIVPYVIACVVAMLFHTTSIIYLIFILAVKTNYEKIKQISTIVLITGMPLLFLFRGVANYIFPRIPYFSLKYMQYINKGNMIRGATLFDWVLFLLIMISTSLATKRDFYMLTERTQKLVKISYLIYCLTLLRGLGNNGYRIALMVYPVFYVMMDNVVSETENRSTSLLLKICLVVFPLLSLIVWWGPINPNNMFDIVKTEMWRVWEYYYH